MAFENGLNAGIILQGTPTTHPVLPQNLSDQLQANQQLGLTNAQTGLVQANTGLVGAQQQGAELQNQINSIQLQQRQASMKIAQEMAQEYGKPAAGSVSPGVGNPQGSSGSVSPGEGLQPSVPAGSMPPVTPGPSQSTTNAELGGSQGSNIPNSSSGTSGTTDSTGHASSANYNNQDFMGDYFNRLATSGAFTPQEIFAMRKDYSNANSGMVKAAADADKSVAEANAAKATNTAASSKAAAAIQEYIGQAGLPIAKALQANNMATVNALVPQFAAHMGDLAVAGASAQLPPGQVLSPQQEQQLRQQAFNQWGNTNDPSVQHRLLAITGASTAGQELAKTNSTLALQGAETGLAGANTSNVRQKTGLEAAGSVADIQADVAAKQNALNKTQTAMQLAQNYLGGHPNATLNDIQVWLGGNPQYAEYKALLAPSNLNSIKESLGSNKLNQNEYQQIAPTQINTAMPAAAVVNLLGFNQKVQAQQLQASQLQAQNIAKVTSGAVPGLDTSGAKSAGQPQSPAVTPVPNPVGVESIKPQNNVNKTGVPTLSEIQDYANRHNVPWQAVVKQLRDKGVNVQ